jgi:hypothetical protein
MSGVMTPVSLEGAALQNMTESLPTARFLRAGVWIVERARKDRELDLFRFR